MTDVQVMPFIDCFSSNQSPTDPVISSHILPSVKYEYRSQYPYNPNLFTSTDDSEIKDKTTDQPVHSSHVRPDDTIDISQRPFTTPLSYHSTMYHSSNNSNNNNNNNRQYCELLLMPFYIYIFSFITSVIFNWSSMAVSADK
ncbi:unnamed protein product [Trichobilharzia regenti]|nr:unnamed protein product [Trichobilharzia regenti]